MTDDKGVEDTMQTIWIIGGGRIGTLAAERITGGGSRKKLIVIDKDQDTCRRLSDLNIETVCMDGISFLAENLEDTEYPVSRIIPAIPVHVAYEWIGMRLMQEGYRMESLAVPETVTLSLPNPLQGDSGQWYFSHADFICPDDCPELDGICTFTGEPRPDELAQQMAAIKHESFISVVVQSRQILPGVGGFGPEDLFQALRTIKIAGQAILLSTACRCHGVMHAFDVI